jgi:hypothetical protein
MFTQYNFDNMYESIDVGSAVDALPAIKNNATIGAWAASNDYAFDGTIPDVITLGSPMYYKLVSSASMPAPYKYYFLMTSAEYQALPNPIPSDIKITYSVPGTGMALVSVAIAGRYNTTTKKTKYSTTVQMTENRLNNLLSDVTNILTNVSSTSQGYKSNTNTTVPCNWTKVREEVYVASSPVYGQSKATSYKVQEFFLANPSELLPNYTRISGAVAEGLPTTTGQIYSNLTQTVTNLAGKTSTATSKKITIRNSSSNIYLRYYYSLGSSTGSNIPSPGAQHTLYIETWDGDPTNASSKQLYSDTTNYPQYMPNIGGETTLSRTNQAPGILYISASDNHVCITSKWKPTPTSSQNYYYAYLSSKFAHNCSWLDSNSKPIATIKIYPQLDSRAYTGRFYNPFNNITTYTSSAYYTPYSPKTLNDNALVYKDSTNTNQFILLPIFIKDDNVGLFGNLSSECKIYSIVGIGKTTIKDGNEITLSDGSKYIKFTNHAVKVE